MTTIVEDKDKEYHLKRLLELSLKTLGAVPWLDDPTDEQKEWFVRRMRGSKKSWEVWNQ
jgi:hypothetical protein